MTALERLHEAISAEISDSLGHDLTYVQKSLSLWVDGNGMLRVMSTGPDLRRLCGLEVSP